MKIVTNMKVSDFTKAPELEHDTDDEQCWCNPEVLQLCPECAKVNDDASANEDCWKCAGRGLVHEYDDENTSIIVHKDL